MSKLNINLSEKELLQLYASLSYCMARSRKYGSTIIDEFLEYSDRARNAGRSVFELKNKIESNIKNKTKINEIDERMDNYKG